MSLNSIAMPPQTPATDDGNHRHQGRCDAEPALRTVTFTIFSFLYDSPMPFTWLRHNRPCAKRSTILVMSCLHDHANMTSPLQWTYGQHRSDLEGSCPGNRHQYRHSTHRQETSPGQGRGRRRPLALHLLEA